MFGALCFVADWLLLDVVVCVFMVLVYSYAFWCLLFLLCFWLLVCALCLLLIWILCGLVWLLLIA